MNVQELIISPVGAGSPAIFTAVQGETHARELRMDLLDTHGGPVDLTGSQAFLYVIKPDTNVALIECQTATNGKQNQAACVLTLQAATCPGTCGLLLQILTESGDIRYDNMRLQVEESDIDGIASMSDFGPLAKMLKSTGKINDLLSQTEITVKDISGTAAHMEKILALYGDAFRRHSGGTLSGNVDYLPAADTQGNMILIPKSWNGAGGLVSYNGGENWGPTTMYASDEESLMPSVVVGGEKILVGCGKKLVWGKVSGGALTWQQPVSGPAHTGDSTSQSWGRYLNGKYFVCYNDRASLTAAPIGRNLYVFSANGSCSEVQLPDNRMSATCVAYDPDNQRYFVAGGYALSADTSGQDSYNHKTWIIASTNLKSWSTVYEATDDEVFVDIVVYSGRVLAVPRNSKESGTMRLFGRSVSQIMSRPPSAASFDYSGGEFWATDTASGLFGFVVLAKGTIMYTADGDDFTEIPLALGGESDLTVKAAAAGRYLLLCSGSQYAVYRLDLKGENLTESLQEAVTEYNTLKNKVDTEVSTAAATIEERKQEMLHLITASTDDPGPGADMGDAMLYLVYR